MSVLVSLAELKAYGGITVSTLDAPLQSILDAAEDQLTRLTGQVFAASEAVTDEVHDGHGSAVLYTKQPISAVSQVRIGREKETTLDHTDVNIMLVYLDTRKIRRVDAVWPQGYRNIWVDYTTAENLPPIAIQAIQEIVVGIYRRRGKEGLSQEKLGEYSYQITEEARYSKSWRDAIDTLYVPSI